MTQVGHDFLFHVQSGMTALMLGAVSGNIALVHLLVDNGADVWVTDNVSTHITLDSIAWHILDDTRQSFKRKVELSRICAPLSSEDYSSSEE